MSSRWRMDARWKISLLALLLSVVGCTGSSGLTDGPGDRPGQGKGPGRAQPVSGVPDWVRPGTRLTYYAAAASIAGSRFSWVEDPNGNWEDPKTGKRYRRTDESFGGLPGEGQPTASGDGLSQLDILAVEGNDAIISSDLFGFDRTFNQLLWIHVGGQRINGVIVDGAWVHPAELARLADTGIPGLLILRGQYQSGETTYNALSFVSGLGDNRQSYTYDTQTGLLLSAHTGSGGATSPVTAVGENPPVGNTQLTMTRFLGMRHRTQPGSAGANPEWVAGTTTLRYQGTYNWINPIDPSSGNLTYPMEQVVTLGQRGANWASYVGQTHVPGLGQSSTWQGTSAAAGPYWYDTAALSGMTVGQILDEDPFTGERVTVAAIGPGPQGSLVTIDSEMPGVFRRTVYEQASGTLVAYEARLASRGETYVLQLVERR